MGYLSWDDPEATKFILEKYKPTKTGLRPEKDLPDDALGLFTLGDRCGKAANWIGILSDCLPLPNQSEIFSETFKFNNGAWRLTYRGTPPETLP